MVCGDFDMGGFLNYQFKTLRTKIMVFGIILGLIPLLIVGSTLNWIFEGIRLKEVNSILIQQTQNVSVAIEGYVNNKRKGLESMAFMPAFKDAYVAYRKALESDGIYSTEYQDVEDTYIDFIASITEQGGFDDVLLVSNDGLVVSSLLQGEYHGKNLFDYSLNDELSNTYLMTLSKIESQINISKLDGYEDDRFIYFTSPIFKDGLYLATIIATVPLVDVFDVIQDSGLDRDYNSFRFFEIKSGVLTELFNYSHNESFGSEADLIWTDYDSVYYPDVGSFKSASILPSLSILMEIEFSEDYFLKPLNRTRFVMMMFFIAMAMILALISSNISDSITKPIKRLKDSFQILAKGGKHVTLKTDLKDEVGELLGQFNLMVKNLRKTENKLLESEKLASIGNLSAGVAHEINNPMAIVTSNVSSLKDYSRELVDHLNRVDKFLVKDDRLKECSEILNQDEVNDLSEEMDLMIDETSQALLRVKDIVASMQVFSEVDKEDLVSVSLNDLLNEVSDEMKEVYPKAVINHNFVKSVSLKARKKQLKMVFIRLIDNGIKANEDCAGAIRLHIGESENQAIVCVDDNGCGIESKDRDKIFDPFFTTRDVGKGIGLGLAIAYSIIQAHSGAISVQSVVGKGSRFRVAIPFQSANTLD